MENTSNNPDITELLDAYVNGTLDEQSRLKVEAQLEKNPDLQEQYLQALAISDAVKDDSDIVLPGRRVIDRVRTNIAQEERKSRLINLKGLIPAAAAVVLGILFLNPGGASEGYLETYQESSDVGSFWIKPVRAIETVNLSQSETHLRLRVDVTWPKEPEATLRCELAYKGKKIVSIAEGQVNANTFVAALPAQDLKPGIYHFDVFVLDQSSKKRPVQNIQFKLNIVPER